MPKAAPTQVIVHRIELQETERGMVEAALAAYSFRSVSKGIFNLTSDVTTVVCLLIAYEWLSGKTVIDDVLLAALAVGGDITGGIISSWRTYRESNQYSEEYYDRASSVTGGLRNLLDNIIGVLTGEYIGKVQENWESSNP